MNATHTGMNIMSDVGVLFLWLDLTKPHRKLTPAAYILNQIIAIAALSRGSQVRVGTQSTYVLSGLKVIQMCYRSVFDCSTWDEDFLHSGGGKLDLFVLRRDFTSKVKVRGWVKAGMSTDRLVRLALLSLLELFARFVHHLCFMSLDSDTPA